MLGLIGADWRLCWLRFPDPWADPNSRSTLGFCNLQHTWTSKRAIMARYLKIETVGSIGKGSILLAILEVQVSRSIRVPPMKPRTNRDSWVGAGCLGVGQLAIPSGNPRVH